MLSEHCKYRGAIVIADALGTKGKWTQKNYRELIREYVELLDDVKVILQVLEKNSIINNSYISPKIFTISDTIIGIFLGDRNSALKYASLWSSYLVVQGITKDIYFRGSLGYGEIYLNEQYQIILGPTIDEVAEWHDKGLIIGIYTAPSAVFYDYGKDVFGKIGNPFVRYKIKIKNSYEYNCWITNWPNIMKSNYDDIPDSNDKKMDFDKLVENRFSKNIGVDDFQKIAYSLEFFNKMIFTNHKNNI